MKRYLIIFVLCIIVGDPAFSQPSAAAIEQYIEQARKDWNVPGMSVAIVKDGKIFSSRGYGLLKEGGETDVDEHTLFAIASNTKAFISSAIGILQQESVLDLNDKVRQYIPQFTLYDSYASSESTLADLLCHRIGLGTYSGDVIWYKSGFTAKEVVDKIRFVPQAFGFRGGYGYSNLMFITAGEVIEKATGMPWHRFVQERFFDPLQMDRSITSTTMLEAKGNYAIPHKPQNDENTPIDWVNWDNMGAAGGIISSANDMANWLIFQLDNGIWHGDTLLQPSVQNILWTVHNSYKISLEDREHNPGTKFSGYGLGWNVSDYYGNTMITHGGGYDGMYSQVAMVPEMNLGIVILTNTMKSIATPLRYYIINAFSKNEEKDWSSEALKRSRHLGWAEQEKEKQRKARAMNTHPSLSIDDYAGVYYTDMLGKIIILESEGELRMEFQRSPDLSATLEHWHFDTWKIRWDKTHAWFDFGTIQFKLDTKLNITGFEFDVPNYDIFFHELNVTKTD